jgi:membrane-bound ClpP family serine protease
MRAFILSLLFISVLFAQNEIVLKGYIGPEEYKTAEASLPKEGELTLTINSTSSDLNATLDFARKLYQLKPKVHLKVVIEDTALGPTAILPLLADERSTTAFVSWGDIPLGSEKVLPTNILLNQVESLLPKDSPLIKEVARAMIDPNSSFRDFKLPNQTLVLNRRQLDELNLGGSVIEKAQAQPVVVQGYDSVFKQHIKFNPDGENLVGRIVIDDRTQGISQATWIYVKKALDSYKESKPIFVILELNTPGGEVYSAQLISDALRDLDAQHDIPVVAYINNWAISAGAMLAYSSRFIVPTSDASMGAAEPVYEGEGGKMETASEKVNSAIRTDFANRAAFFGRNPAIAEAMVDKDIILVKRHGKIIKLDQESQVRLDGPDPDIMISPKGKLLTLNAKEMLDYGVANFIATSTKLEPLTQQEIETGKYPAKKTLLFQEPYLASIPNTQITTYQMDFRTRFFAFLALPAVSSLLFLGLMVGAYMEISSPGFGLPGTVALTCLILIILSSYYQEIGSNLEVILLLLGLAIILFDLFVFPTFGLLGIIGALFFFGGLFALMLPGLSSLNYEFDTQTFNAAGEAFLHRLAWLSGAFLVGMGMIVILARFVLPNFSGFQRFVLEGHEQKGYTSFELHEDWPKPGDSGVAITSLRPSGKVSIKDHIYDAVSSGQFIEVDEPVEVLRTESGQLVVNIDYRRKK